MRKFAFNHLALPLIKVHTVLFTFREWLLFLYPSDAGHDLLFKLIALLELLIVTVVVCASCVFKFACGPILALLSFFLTATGRCTTTSKVRHFGFRIRLRLTTVEATLMILEIICILLILLVLIFILRISLTS